MTEEKTTISLKVYVAAFLLRCIVKVLSLTYRVSIVEGEELVQDLANTKTPTVLCAWHNRIFFLTSFVKTRLIRHGFKLTQLASLSKDGDLGYLLGKWAGVNVVRGSSNRGGTTGLRKMFRAMNKHGDSVILLPDGSQGPMYEAKAGTVVLAQLSQAPVYFFSYDVDRCWRVKSWDRLIVPKPFSNITFKIAGPVTIPRELSKNEMEQERKKIEDQLNSMKLLD